MLKLAAAAAAGLVFGLGLILSGMSDPAKVLNFLDLAGRWDPSLAFVMAGAIAVTVVGYRWAMARGRPLFETRFHLPATSVIDARLVCGAALFGLGWGLSGFCPGPALVSLPLASPGILMFFPAMVIGMWLGRLLLSGPTLKAAARHPS